MMHELLQRGFLPPIVPAATVRGADPRRRHHEATAPLGGEHTDVVAMLKKEYGMTHGAAHRVSLVARQEATPAAAAGQGSDPAGDLYTGKKASLRPLHDALLDAIRAFGDDVELAPKKGYLSLRRRKALRDDPAQRRLRPRMTST